MYSGGNVQVLDRDTYSLYSNTYPVFGTRRRHPMKIECHLAFGTALRLRSECSSYSDNSGYPNQTSSSSRYNAHIFVGILGVFALSISLIV